MIAIDPPVRFLDFLLHSRGRPHMSRGSLASRTEGHFDPRGACTDARVGPEHDGARDPRGVIKELFR